MCSSPSTHWSWIPTRRWRGRPANLPSPRRAGSGAARSARSDSRPVGRKAVTTLGHVGVPAFKEWAVIVHALLEGEQILDVRKGGLHEDERRFGLKSRRV